VISALISAPLVFTRNDLEAREERQRVVGINDATGTPTT
jgi:hypothetical protein